LKTKRKKKQEEEEKEEGEGEGGREEGRLQHAGDIVAWL